MGGRWLGARSYADALRKRMGAGTLGASRQVDPWPLAVKKVARTKRGKTQGSKWVANARRYLPAALDTALIRPAACGLVTSCWIRIAVGVTSLP